MFAHPAGDGEDFPRAVDCGGQDCAAAVRGLSVFLDRQPDGLGGNGRACADCHMPTGQFQLSPADAETRYQILQFRRRFDPKADDPLFRPIDADDFRVNGAQASDYTTLRQHASSASYSLARGDAAYRSGHKPALERNVRRRVALRALNR